MVPFSTIYLSLVGLFSTLGLIIERKYAVLFNNLCRKYREPDLHCINKKNPGYPHFLEKTTTTTTTTGDIVSRKALDFSRRLPRGGWQQINKNKVFRGLVIWVNHLIANCVCVGQLFCSQYCVESKVFNTISSHRRSKKDNKGTDARGY